MDTQERADAIQGLRDLADFLETHPTVPAPTYSMLNVIVAKDELIAAARATSWKKEYGGDYFWLRKEFKGPLYLDLTVAREQVCRRVVTGTEVVPAQPEHTVEKVEWVCEEASLLAPQ